MSSVGDTDGGTARDEGGLTQQDRDAAVAALDVHREAGRLDDVGFEERSVRAQRAYSRADLDLLFLDLPEPRPVLGAPAWGSQPAGGPPAPSGQPPSPQPAGGQPVGQPVSGWPRANPSGGLVPEPWARYVVALSPFIALVLFFVLRTWVVFLFIPIAGIIAYGPDSKGRRRHR